MSRALYRKYRSKSLKEVVGQDHIVSTLSKALRSNRVRHAYLFSGPRGVGKTSVARILAHEVNNIPYKDDGMHLDIIEIDAASNRRIDEIRDLREKVNVAPTSSRYKVYIIDEVHMLTREAFNALLKTLEEPPEHVIFILATTEVHKLPETIISRTQHFTFKPIDKAAAVNQLSAIAKAEKIKVDAEALELLAGHGQGSFRDSISLLDQLSAHSDRVTAVSARELVGAPPAQLIEDLDVAVTAGDSAAVLSVTDELNNQGANPALVAKLIAEKLRAKLVGGQSVSIDLLKELLEVPASPDSRQSLELALLRATTKNQRPESPQPPLATASLAAATAEQPVADSPKNRTIRSSKSHSNQPFSLEDWPKVLEAVKAQAPSLYTALRLARPALADSHLTLAFEFQLHQKKVNNAASLDLIRSVVENFGKGVSIETTVQKTEPVLAAETDNGQPQSLENISNIFGNTEVIES